VVRKPHALERRAVMCAKTNWHAFSELFYSTYFWAILL
jgi:hypothetical protein